MLDNSFYMEFSAFVQIAVAFNFGLLFLYQNNRSIFKSIQTAFCDAFRKNKFLLSLLRYPMYVADKVKVRNSGKLLCQWKGRLMQGKDIYSTAPNKVRMCDHLAALGIVSGFFSMAWLLYVPWVQKYISCAEDIYITLTVATIITDICMVFYTIKHKTRAKTFIYSVIVMTIWYIIALILYNRGLTANCLLEFDTFFLFSMAVPFAPICFFILDLLCFAIYRLIILNLILVAALFLHAYIQVFYRFRSIGQNGW